MSLLTRLFGRRSDPTLGWGPFSLPIPEFNLSTMRFGTLNFGDAFDAAAFLGRPNTFTWTQGEYCELLYASGGFQLDFDGDKFAYAAFFIGPDGELPKHPAMMFSEPRLRGCTPDGIRLSRDTDRALLEQLLGSPATIDPDVRETILYYRRRDIMMEFELDGETGRLKRWNLAWSAPCRNARVV